MKNVFLLNKLRNSFPSDFFISVIDIVTSATEVYCRRSEATLPRRITYSDLESSVNTGIIIEAGLGDVFEDKVGLPNSFQHMHKFEFDLV